MSRAESDEARDCGAGPYRVTLETRPQLRECAREHRPPLSGRVGLRAANTCSPCRPSGSREAGATATGRHRVFEASFPPGAAKRREAGFGGWLTAVSTAQSRDGIGRESILGFG